LGDCSGQRRRDLLRMVYRAIPVVLPEQAFLLLVSRERER
jgi:hypothetical protein